MIEKQGHYASVKALGINRAWAGVEAFMPDGIPVLGASPAAPNLVHAFGFSAHGFELGPIGGQIVAELITEGRSSQPIDAFAVDRFARPAVSSASSAFPARSLPD